MEGQRLRRPPGKIGQPAGGGGAAGRGDGYASVAAPVELPPQETLIAIAAQRAGMSIRRYVRSRTRMEFLLEMQGWSATVTLPLKLLLGAFGGGQGRGQGKGGRISSPSGSSMDIYGHVRRVAGRNYQVFDLGPVEGELASPDRLDVQQYAASLAHLRADFAAESRQWGSGGGLAQAPLREVPAAWR